MSSHLTNKLPSPFIVDEGRFDAERLGEEMTVHYTKYAWDRSLFFVIAIANDSAERERANRIASRFGVAQHANDLIQGRRAIFYGYDFPDKAEEAAEAIKGEGLSARALGDANPPSTLEIIDL